jgi:hypothetical protein
MDNLTNKKSLADYHFIDRSEIPDKSSLEESVARLERDIEFLSKFETDKYKKSVDRIKPTLAFLRLLLSRCR